MADFIPLMTLSGGTAGGESARGPDVSRYVSIGMGAGLQLSGPRHPHMEERNVDMDAVHLLFQAQISSVGANDHGYIAGKLGLGNWLINGNFIGGKIVGINRPMAGIEGNLALFHMAFAAVNMRLPDFVPTVEGGIVYADNKAEGHIGLTVNLFNALQALD